MKRLLFPHFRKLTILMLMLNLLLPLALRGSERDVRRHEQQTGNRGLLGDGVRAGLQ